MQENRRFENLSPKGEPHPERLGLLSATEPFSMVRIRCSILQSARAFRSGMGVPIGAERSVAKDERT